MVFVRGDGPIALVKILSKARFEDSPNPDLDWFKNRRDIEVLGYYDDWKSTLPNSLPKNAYWGDTLNICKTFKGSVYSANYLVGDYIKHWNKLIMGMDLMDIIKGLEKVCLEYQLEKTTKPITGNDFVKFFTHELKDSISIFIQEFEHFKCRASAGAGNWAEIPWISFLNDRITNTTQKGVYPVILFPTHGEGFYLSINQGTSFTEPKLSKKEKEKSEKLIRKKIWDQFDLPKWSRDELKLDSSTSLGRSYERPNIYSKYYEVGSIDKDGFFKDLIKTLEVCDSIGKDWQNYESIYHTNFEEKIIEVEPVNKTISFPSLSILAGISGTGKSRYVKTQALLSNGYTEDSTSKIDNYCLVPVRPDWHEPSDLLGYVSRITNKFNSTDFVEFVLNAWEEVFKFYRDINLISKNEVIGEPRPFWLCLDEMNLAPVEQFFADFLSVYESRKWSQGYFCEPLIKESVHLIKDSTLTNLPDEFWAKFESVNGIPIPPNLMVVGTVNMDETTHGFSRKVLDRAFSVDFADFFPNNFDAFFGKVPIGMKALSFPRMSHLLNNGQYIGEKFNPNNLTILSQAKDFLNSLNTTALKSTPFEVGYRALDQLLLMVEYWYEGDIDSLSSEQDKRWLASVLDGFVMTKILPRIEGDIDKLGIKTIESDSNILKVLKEFLIDHAIFKIIVSEGSIRFDLFRGNDDDSIEIPCRSIMKIDWMISRLEKSGYTSFWI